VGDADLAQIIYKFPSPISRDQVASFWNGNNTNFRRLFLASMIWGWVLDGRGPSRTKEMLDSPNAIEILQATAESVVVGHITAAYEEIKIRKLGPAFFSKFLYFVGLGAGAAPLPVILDTRVATSLETLGAQEGWAFTDFTKVTRNKKHQIAYVKPYAEGYMRYVETLGQWARELGCPRADFVEYFLWRNPI